MIKAIKRMLTVEDLCDITKDFLPDSPQMKPRSDGECGWCENGVCTGVGLSDSYRGSSSINLVMYIECQYNNKVYGIEGGWLEFPGIMEKVLTHCAGDLLATAKTLSVSMESLGYLLGEYCRLKTEAPRLAGDFVQEECRQRKTNKGDA